MIHSSALKNNKVILRAVEPDDIDFIMRLENDESIWRYGSQYAPLSRSAIEAYVLTYDADPLRSGELRLMITDASSGEICGAIDLYRIDSYCRTAFVGIAISPEFRKCGYAVEALHAICSYSRHFLNLRILAAEIAQFNTQGLSLFSKAGFTQTGFLPKWINSDDKNWDLNLFSKEL